jgi:hypothetical protein
MALEVIMKKLNFYPYYRDLLERERKTTTLRLPSSLKFSAGEEVLLTVGWPESGSPEVLHSALVESTYQKRIRDLNPHDLEGESPDCTSRDAVKYVLGAIYRRVLSDDDFVDVVKFRHAKRNAKN